MLTDDMKRQRIKRAGERRPVCGRGLQHLLPRHPATLLECAGMCTSRAITCSQQGAKGTPQPRTGSSVTHPPGGREIGPGLAPIRWRGSLGG